MPPSCGGADLGWLYLMAVSTSCSLTYSRRCMAACASLMRMMDSRWRTAMGMPWLTALSLLSSVYTCHPGYITVMSYFEIVCSTLLVVWVHQGAAGTASTRSGPDAVTCHCSGAYLSNLVVVSILQLGPAILLCIGNVFAQLVVRDDVGIHLVLCWPCSARLVIRLTLRLLACAHCQAVTDVFAHPLC